MYWYPYNHQDINDYRMKCIIAEHGHESYWIYMNLVDMSIPGNGILRLDPKHISVVLNYQKLEDFEKLLKILNALEEYKLITHEPGYYLIHTVRERVGNAEERLLNSKSINDEEKQAALLEEVMTELSFVNYCSFDAEILIQDALDKLLKKYCESEILKATKQFAIDYAVTTHEEREKIESLEKYYFSSIIKKLSKPASTQKTIYKDTFVGLMKDANFFCNPNEISQAFQAYENLVKKHAPKDILEATRIFLQNISLNVKEIKNKCGYLTATISKILRNKKKESTNTQEGKQS